MLDRGRGRALCKVKHEKDHKTAAGPDSKAVRTFFLRRAAKVDDHCCEWRARKVELQLAHLRFDGIEDVQVLGKIGDQHLVNETRRAVLHDRSGLGQERHVELRRVRVSGEDRRCEKQVKADGQEPSDCRQRPLHYPASPIRVEFSQLGDPKPACK
jgi:hypothetical protein